MKLFYIRIIYYAFIISILIFSYLFYFSIKYSKPTENPQITPKFQTEHPVCGDACQVVRSQNCKEWQDVIRPHICEFTCEAYLRRDELDNSPEWATLFKCASEAKSQSDLLKCQITCTVMDEL